MPRISALPAGASANSTDQLPTNQSGTTRRITVAQIAAAVLPDGDKGDITVSSSGTNWQIDANAVTNTELNDMAALSVKARTPNSVGDPSDATAVAGEYGAFRERSSNLSFRRESYQALSISSGTATFTVATSPNATLTHDDSATLIINLASPVNGEGGRLILTNGAAGQPYDEPTFQLNGSTTNVLYLEGVDVPIYNPNNDGVTIFGWTFDGTRLVVWVDASNYTGS